MTKKLESIKNWAEDDRPREKLISKGISSLSDAELIAILIGSGNREESAVELSKKILKSANNNINELAKQTINDLQKHKGIGEAKAISIVSALELGRRRNASEILKKKQIRSSQSVFEIFGNMLGDLPYEEFWVIFLNRANKIIDKQKISSGGISGTVTDVKIIMKKAIEKLASGIILCHNHPSGNVNPSESDDNITRKLKEAGIILEIQVLDHVIVSDETYYSYADSQTL